jgi:hypothetical protein
VRAALKRFRALVMFSLGPSKPRGLYLMTDGGCVFKSAVLLLRVAHRSSYAGGRERSVLRLLCLLHVCPGCCR